ncbi:hypothetical protein Tco_1548518 [Tanacetum coccineum]
MDKGSFFRITHCELESSDSIKSQLLEQALILLLTLPFSQSVEPKNYKDAFNSSMLNLKPMQEDLNEFELLRTRLDIARGYRQEEGIDFEESFAPVARLDAI